MHKLIALGSLALIAVAGCAQDHTITAPRADRATDLSANLASERADGPGAVYALTNAVGANAVAVFARNADGSLAWTGNVATGGAGAGSGLGSQSAIALSDDGRWLVAVNAGSNDISAFSVGEAGPSLTGRVASGGIRPISVTVHGDLVYVLNAGNDGNISGFRIDHDGALAPIPQSTRPLSSTAAGPAQVSFSPDGRWLVVTEKSTNRLDVYGVTSDGVAWSAGTTASAGGTPFGFAFGHRGEVFVSEAAGSASSYVLDGGALSLASGAIVTHQGAPCWAVVTNNGRFGFTANAQGGSISGFAIAPDGTIRLIDADGRTAIVGPGNIDLAVSGNSRYLYQLNGNRSISGFRIEADGHLTSVGTALGLPASAVGLAAR
ncbi:MAG TPA: beta-propeller fold lactonase family protein [Gemmatimonadales bacterium]|nr:beta-propeller fold lactonase family protein [Gemmatimonadales bacterium]